MRKIGIYLYALLLFLVIYNPPFKAGLSFTTIAVIISVIICFFCGKEFRFFIGTRGISSVIKCFFAFMIYDIFFSVFFYLTERNDLILNSCFRDILSHISICMLSAGLVVFALKNKWSASRFCHTYIIAGVYQAILGVVCLVSPDVKSFFSSMIIANSSSSKISSSVEYWAGVRNFGFASTLYDIFGMAMSLLAVLSIAQGLKTDKKYYILAALISLVAVINSRTSFFLITVGAIIMILSHKNKIITTKWLVQRASFFAIAIAFVFGGMTWLLGNASTDQLEWMATALTDSQSMVEGREEGFYDTLFNRFIIFPSDFASLLFGTGMTSADAINHNSDVGYIQYIWKHGLLGSFLLYYIYYKLFKSAKLKQQWPYSTFVIALSAMVLVYLVKLTCLGYSMASVIFIPICLYFIVTNEKNKSIALNNKFKYSK